MPTSVMVTGGLGYIGSHAVQRLLRDGHEVVIVDNLFRGHREVLELLAQEESVATRMHFVHADIANRSLVRKAIMQHRVDVVMHFAALAYVGESVESPLTYYRNNVAGLIELLTAIDEARRITGLGVSRFVFSSTCAVYGDTGDAERPLAEDTVLAPVSAYGRSKLMCEQILRDEAARLAASDVPIACAALRYFNVCGCDRTGVLGEDHRPETHLIPIILEVASGKRSHVAILGDDYATPDGTAIRDYVHVEDLVDAHVRVMNVIKPGQHRVYNVGTGRGASVLEVLRAVQQVTGVGIPTRVLGRRSGDAARAVANASCIMRELDWKPSVPQLPDMIASAWSWVRRHPGGYAS